MTMPPQSAAYHDRHCKLKSPLYAGQTVSVLNDAKTLWLPATVICRARHGSYLVQVIGGGQYRHVRDHIHECNPDAVKRGTLTSTDVAPATPESSPGLFPVGPVTAAQALHQLLQQHPNHQLYPQLPDQWTLQGNHQLQLFCRNHPLEVPQR